jgi:uncharacterized metal-binding protein
MVELPSKKVGIVACSGEEMAEGTVTRLAALQVLEELRPKDTVTICLPLFLAGGEGDRAFARFYPTIAIDGCELRCAARGTEMYSGKLAASLVVTEIVKEAGLLPLKGSRRLNEAGYEAVELTAKQAAALVDELLNVRWSRRTGEIIEEREEEKTLDEPTTTGESQTTCQCGSGIPIQTIYIDNEPISLVGLPLIFKLMREAGKLPSEDTTAEILETVKIYNSIPEGKDKLYIHAMLNAYKDYFNKESNP